MLSWLSFDLHCFIDKQSLSCVPEAFAEPYQPSKTEVFAKIVNTRKLLIIFLKSSILDVGPGSKYGPVCFHVFCKISALKIP